MLLSDPTWFRVSLPYATYGVAVKGGRVVDAAPIARWMVGKEMGYCFDWLHGKGADIEPL